MAAMSGAELIRHLSKSGTPNGPLAFARLPIQRAINDAIEAGGDTRNAARSVTASDVIRAMVLVGEPGVHAGTIEKARQIVRDGEWVPPSNEMGPQVEDFALDDATIDYKALIPAVPLQSQFTPAIDTALIPHDVMRRPLFDAMSPAGVSAAQSQPPAAAEPPDLFEPGASTATTQGPDLPPAEWPRPDAASPPSSPSTPPATGVTRPGRGR